MANNEKMNISYTIRAIDKFTKTHDKLDRQLGQLERKLDQLSDIETVKVDADTVSFNRKMDRAKDKADDIPKVKMTHLMVTGFNNYMRRMDRVATSLRTFDEVLGGIGQGTILTLLPTLGPALGILAGGVGAIGAAFLSAGIGSAGFAAVAVPAISDVFKANEELAKAQEAVKEAADEEERAVAVEALAKVQARYNEEQWDSVKAIQSFSSFFSKFADKFQKPVLQMFNDSLAVLQTFLEALEPAIGSVSDAVQILIDKFHTNLESADMKAFFEWLGDTAGPYLDKLVSAVGNFIAGLVNMFVAFDPLAQSFADGFLEMSENFREWSSTLDENQAFQDFLNFVRDNAPTLLSLFGNIITTLVNFGIAAEPFTTKLLEVADAFFAWTSELFENHKWVGMLLAILPVLFGLFKILWPIVNFGIGVFQMLWPVITTVWGWMVKLGGVFMRVIPVVFGLGKRLLAFLGPVGAVASIVLMLADIFGISWEQIANITAEIWGALPGFITGPLEWIAEKVSGVFGWITEVVSGKGDEMTTNLGEDLTNMQTEFDTKLPQMNTSVGTNFGNMYNTTSMYTGQMAGTTGVNLSQVRGNFYSNLTGADSTVTNKFASMNSTVGSNMGSMNGTTASELGLMSLEFDKSLSTIDTGLITDFSSMDSTVSEYMSQMEGTTAADLGLMETDFSSSLSSIDSDVLSNFSGMSGNVDEYMGLMETGISSGWGSAESDTATKTGAMNRETTSQFVMMLNAVKLRMHIMLTTIKSVWSQAQTFLKSVNLHSTGANIIQGLINGVNSKRSGLISAVSSAANAAVNAANSRLKIHSPSRVFREIGEFTGQGFIVGLANMTPKISKASGRMADAAVPNVPTTSYGATTNYPTSAGGYGTHGNNAGDGTQESSVLSEILAELRNQRQTIVRIEGDNEAIRAYVNEQNAVDDRFAF